MCLDVLHEIRGGLRHSAPETCGTKSAAFAGQGHEAPLRAVLAREHGEASAEQTAIEVSLELAAYELGQRRAGEALLHGSVERLQILSDHSVQRAELGPAPLVAVAMAASRNRALGHTRRRNVLERTRHEDGARARRVPSSRPGAVGALAVLVPAATTRRHGGRHPAVLRGARLDSSPVADGLTGSRGTDGLPSSCAKSRSS